MFDPAHTELRPARDVARTTSLTAASNGLRWASYGFTEVPVDTVQHIVEAVPAGIARQLTRRAYYFVPLALGETEETEIASGYTLDLSDRATCHRNVVADGAEFTFISTRLMQDRFALAFEFFINIGHQFVDCSSVPGRFSDLLWAQARADVRGETSQDAWEARKRALEIAAAGAVAPHPGVTVFPAKDGAADEHGSGRGVTAQPGIGSLAGFVPSPDGAPGESFAGALATTAAAANGASGAATREARGAGAFFEAAFADSLAIYMLSLAMDLDYADLREREYPLLAAPALADRLRLMAELFPPAAPYEFAIRYRRRR